MEEYRENLNEEQHGRSLLSRGKTAFEKFHSAAISLADPGDVKPPMIRNEMMSILLSLNSQPSTSSHLLQKTFDRMK
jgi:hypothetical protein